MTTVDQGFVQVEHEGGASQHLRTFGRQQGCLVTILLTWVLVQDSDIVYAKILEQNFDLLFSNAL